MRARSLARLAALVLLCFAAPLAWSQLGSIVGEVRVVRGDFPEPVLVSLQIRGATMTSTYTDNDGRFAFNALYGNIYHVVINDERYQPVDLMEVLKPDIQPVLIVQVLLAPRSGRSPSTAASPSLISAADFTRYPKNAVKEFERGAKNESEGKTEEAIDHYRKAIKQAPNFAIAHNNLGALYLGESKFADAHTELTASIRLAPSDSKPYFNMANLMLLTGKLQDAERYLQDGFRRQPDSAFGFFVQGSVLERSGKLDEAVQALHRALQLDPKLTRTHLELVNIYLLSNRQADAVAELRAFLQSAPSDPLAPKAREVLSKLQAPSPAAR